MATVIKWEGVEVATVQSANQALPYRLKEPSCEVFFLLKNVILVV